MTSRTRSCLVLLALLSTLATQAGGCGAAAPPSMSASPGYEGMPAQATPSSMGDDRGALATEDESPPPAPPPPPPGAPVTSTEGERAGGAEKKEAAADEKPDTKAAEKPAKSTKADDAKTWKRSQLGAHAVRVEIGDHEALPIRSVQAKVALDGFAARVVLDLVVKNDRPQTFEGTLKLRLPTGASPYYFAFGQDKIAIAGDAVPVFFSPDRARTMGGDPAQIRDGRASLWEGVKEARMVPKEKAALAYAQTVRRNVDPAILEWSGPSIFNARVFPLVSGRSHRIVVAYDVPLTRIGEDLEYSFDVPEGSFGKVLDMAIQTPKGATMELTPSAQAFQAQDKQYFRFDEPKAKSISVRMKKPTATHLVATDEKTGPYFAADVAPTMPASATVKGEEGALFLVDTSLSSNPDRFNVWLKLLASVLENNEDSIKRFNVLFFNIEQSFYKPAFVNNDAATRRDLAAFAQGLALEGATDIGAALQRAATAPGGPARYDVFLLSDGAATWGEADAFTMARRLEKSPVSAIYAYQTGLSGTDTDALSLLTRETGGALFSVTGDAEVQKASTAHKTRPLRLVSARVSGGSDVILAGRPRFLFAGQTLRIAGRGRPDKEATLELAVEAAGQKQTLRVPLGQPMESPLAIRSYGQIAVAQIEELAPVTEAMSKAYSIHFRVPGKTASLLMLESEADYQRFGIVPEDFARTIKSAETNRIVEDTLALSSATLGDPKALFMRWLEALPGQPGMRFAIPPALSKALARMPADSFRVDAPALIVKQRDAKSLPKQIATDLASHQLDYDRMSAEAERRKTALGPGDALKALSSLVEENPGDAVLARDVGISAMGYGLVADAFHLFRRVAVARPYEPQTYRAMAQALTRMGRTDLAIAYFEVGLAGQWDGRFGDFRKILAVDYLDLLLRIAKGTEKTSVPDFAKERMMAVAAETGLAGNPDIVVMITWNTDATDVDLHVEEPSGEECFFSNRNTRSGGKLTQDVTQGYGPEMYVMKNAPPGTYEIRANYFASDRNRASTRTKVHVLVIENYGTRDQKTSEKVITLALDKQTNDLFTVKRTQTTKSKPAAEIAGP